MNPEFLKRGNPRSDVRNYRRQAAALPYERKPITVVAPLPLPIRRRLRHKIQFRLVILIYFICPIVVPLLLLFLWR